MQSDDLEGTFRPLDGLIDELHEFAKERDEPPTRLKSITTEYDPESAMSGRIPVTAHFELDTSEFDPTEEQTDVNIQYDSIRRYVSEELSSDSE